MRHHAKIAREVRPGYEPFDPLLGDEPFDDGEPVDDEPDEEDEPVEDGELPLSASAIPGLLAIAAAAADLPRPRGICGDSWITKITHTSTKTVGRQQMSAMASGAHQ